MKGQCISENSCQRRKSEEHIGEGDVWWYEAPKCVPGCGGIPHCVALGNLALVHNRNTFGLPSYFCARSDSFFPASISPAEACNEEHSLRVIFPISQSSTENASAW